MRKYLLPLIIVLLASCQVWAGGLFPGTASDVDFSNMPAIADTSSGSLDSANVLINVSGTNKKMTGENFLDWLTQEGYGAGAALSDLDDLPGDSTNNDKIDGDILNINSTLVSSSDTLGVNPNLSLTSLTLTGSSGITLGVAGSVQGNIKLYSNTPSNTYSFQIYGANYNANLGWRVPASAPGGSNYLVNCDADGTLDYTNPSTFQAADTQLAALAALADGAGYLKNNGAGVFSYDTPTGAGDMLEANYADIVALEALATSGGLACRTATNTWALRTPTGTSNQITVTNGNGISGNPTFSLASAITLPGTLAGGDDGITAGGITFDSSPGAAGDMGYSSGFIFQGGNSETLTLLPGSASNTATLTSATGIDSLDMSAIGLTTKSISIARTTSPQSIALYEGTGSGDNYFLIDVDAMSSNLGWTLPAAAPGGSNYLVNCDADGTMGYTDPSTFLTSGGALGTPSSGTLTNCSGLPISGLSASTATALGVGSIELGHASDTSITRVSAGVAAIEGATIATLTAANAFTGANTIGDVTTNSLQKIILRKPSSLSDHDWQGIAELGTAGETISRGQLLYKKYNSSAWKWYVYDANGTDKRIVPSGLATADITSGQDGVILTDGIMRDDSWNITASADASVTIYATGTTTVGSQLSLTAPSTSGDEVVVVGFLKYGNTIKFRPGYSWVEVK